MRLTTLILATAISFAAGAASAGDSFSTLGNIDAELLTKAEMAAVVGASHTIEIVNRGGKHQQQNLNGRNGLEVARFTPANWGYVDDTNDDYIVPGWN